MQRIETIAHLLYLARRIGTSFHLIELVSPKGDIAYLVCSDVVEYSRETTLVDETTFSVALRACYLCKRPSERVEDEVFYIMSRLGDEIAEKIEKIGHQLLNQLSSTKPIRERDLVCPLLWLDDEGVVDAVLQELLRRGDVAQENIGGEVLYARIDKDFVA